MKSFYAILAFAALSLASCQKEALLASAETIQAAAQNPETQHQTAQNPKGQTANAVQIWILEDTPYAASYGSNGLGQQTLELTSGPKTISAIGSAVNYLPGQIMDVFASLGVAVPVNSAVWQTSTGGFLVEIDQPGLTPTSVFWFNNWYGLRSIGRIQL